MSKALKNSNLTSRPAARTLVAISLSLSLAAFGCTTDRNLGNGDPVTTPGLRTSPTGGTSTGSESTPTVPPSMTSSSSYVGAQAIPSGTQQMRRLSAAEAAAVIAQQAPRVRYLGVTYPNNGGYVSDNVVTGQFQNPALRTNPQLTVNSSLSSQPTAVISSGAGEAAGSTGGGITGAAVVNGTGTTGIGLTSGVTSAGLTGGTTSAGLTVGTTSAGITGTTTSAGLTTGTGLTLGGNASGGAAAIFSPATAGVAGTTLPVGSNATITTVTPSGAITGFPATSTVTPGALNGTTAAANSTVGVSNTTTTANATATATDTTTAASTQSTGRVANPVRIVRNANGRAVITNATSTTTTSTSTTRSSNR
jgi:hypothetical protein